MRITSLGRDAVRFEVARLRPAAEGSRAVEQAVAEILSDVRERGDEALLELTRRLDWPSAEVGELLIAEEELDAALEEIDEQLREAFETARNNLAWFHMHERRNDWDEEARYGQRLGIRHLPVARAGLYVPGGLGAYASTVIMNAVPAQVAGVGELFICTPPGRNGSVNHSVMAAARYMGVNEVYRVGGAQAVAAMAYGTSTIRRADVICGPGNAYVMEAKRQVYGQVGIDGLAGPSEVIVVAGSHCEPEWIAADLLAQEEHGSGASAILFGETEELCGRVSEAILSMRPASLGEAAVFAFFPEAGESFRDLALAFVNEYAPEHLEVHLPDARAFAGEVTSAGAIFLGELTPTAYGDYIAGSNHVLPTGGAARFASPLSVDTFMRKSALVELTPGATRHLVPHLARLAASEGFVFHRLSGELRARGGRTAGENS